MFDNISKEFYWKVNIELAQFYDRTNNNLKCNEYLKNSISDSPENTKWKLWLIASRIMLNTG